MHKIKSSEKKTDWNCRDYDIYAFINVHFMLFIEICSVESLQVKQRNNSGGLM